MEWALANRSKCPRLRVSTITAMFEKFVNIDIQTTTLADIVEMLKTKRTLTLPKISVNRSTNATISSTATSDQNVRILLAAKDRTK